MEPSAVCPALDEEDEELATALAPVLWAHPERQRKAEMAEIRMSFCTLTTFIHSKLANVGRNGRRSAAEGTKLRSSLASR